MNALASITSLPTLVRNAASKLASAETAAEVLDVIRQDCAIGYASTKAAGRLAKAKHAHDEIITTVYRTQADVLDIESMAKRRLADEYDAAQERGEVRGPNERTVSERETVGFRDLGLSGREIHEARQIRDAEVADPGIVKRTLDTLVAEGQEPSRARLREAVVEAARQGLVPDRTDRRNPEYVNDPAYRMLLRILGPSRAMMEQVDAGEIEIATARRGFLDNGQRDRALRDIARARDFLTDFLENAHAN